jgi:type I restriction enzyme S subunit
MSNWTRIRLGDFIDVITDYHANGAYEKLKENISLKYEPDFAIMIRTLNFESNDFKSNLIYLNEKEYNYLSKSKVLPYDLIMNKIANPGSVYLMPDLNKPVSLAMNLFLIRFNEKIDPKFMFYLMKINEPYIKRFANGTTTKTITKDAVRALNFAIPNLIIQRQIASILFNIDSKIEFNNSINAELEAMAKTIYDYWFVQFDFPNVKGKPYKSSGGKMVWNEELKREIPVGWEVKLLGTEIEVQRGISYTSKEINGEGIPMINLASFNLDGTYKPEGVKSYSGKFTEKNIVKAGELLIAATDVTRNADIIGKAILVPDYYNEELVFSMDIAKIISTNIPSSYLMMLFNSNHYHNYIKWYASGTIVLHLNLDGVKRYNMELPPKHLLEKFHSLYQPIAERIYKTALENKKLAELRDWLLPMLMNGQVKVGDAEKMVEGKLSMAAEPSGVYKKSKVR